MPREGGLVEFRVWAPAAAAVDVRVRGADHALVSAGDGMFEGDLPAAQGFPTSAAPVHVVGSAGVQVDIFAVEKAG